MSHEIPLQPDDLLENAQFTPQHHEAVDAEVGIEFFECVKCGEWNIIKNTPNKRRTTRVRHIRLDPIVYGSLKRYATINGVTMNHAMMLLLHNSRTDNISYLVNERKLVEKSNKKKRNI